MEKKSKVVSLCVIFDDEQKNTYVMEWVEKKIGKKAIEVVVNKGIIDTPGMEADDEYKGYRIWELAF